MYKFTRFVEQAAAPTFGVLDFCATLEAAEAPQDARQVLTTVMSRTHWQAFAADVNPDIFPADIVSDDPPRHVQRTHRGRNSHADADCRNEHASENGDKDGYSSLATATCSLNPHFLLLCPTRVWDSVVILKGGLQVCFARKRRSDPCDKRTGRFPRY